MIPPLGGKKKDANIYDPLLQASYYAKYIYKHLINSSQVVCSYFCFTNGQVRFRQVGVTH